MEFKELKSKVKKRGLMYAQVLLKTVQNGGENPFGDGKSKAQAIELIESVIRSYEQDLQLKKWGIQR